MGDWSLIDAVKFSTAFTAFWNTATPTCEHFVRKLNLNLYNREDDVMATSSTEDRAFVAEYGFSLFVERGSPSEPKNTTSLQEKRAHKEAKRRIEYLGGKKEVPEKLSADQISEAKEIERRLSNFFYSDGSTLFLRPVFSGSCVLA
jgi:hypothetical protein